MASTFPSSVNIARVAEAEIVHDRRERDICHLDNKMNVVSHQAKSMGSVSKPFYTFLDEQIEMGTVNAIKEDVLPCVST